MERIKFFSCILLLLTAFLFATRLGHASILNTTATLDLQDSFKEEWDMEDTVYDSGSDVSSYFDFISTNSSIVTNVTLDFANNTVIPHGFEISALQPGWFEYYNRSSEFVGGGNSDSCASTHSHLPSFGEAVEGVWAVCANCWNESYCPSITYKNYQVEFEGLRTLQFRYYLSGIATLRLTVQGKCYDYSMKQNTSSKCTFLGMGSQHDEWRKSTFTVENENATTFRVFKIELIVESATDLILIDKVEGTTVYMLVDDDENSSSTLIFASSNVILCVLILVFLFN